MDLTVTKGSKTAALMGADPHSGYTLQGGYSWGDFERTDGFKRWTARGKSPESYPYGEWFLPATHQLPFLTYLPVSGLDALLSCGATLTATNGTTTRTASIISVDRSEPVIDDDGSADVTYAVTTYPWRKAWQAYTAPDPTTWGAVVRPPTVLGDMPALTEHRFASKDATSLMALSVLPNAYHPAASSVYFGAYLAGVHDMPGVLAYEALTGSHLDSQVLFYDMADTPEVAFISALIAHGTLPIITFEPNGYNNAALAGAGHDAAITAFFAALNGLGTVWVRPCHEMNGNWYDWAVDHGGISTGNTVATFTAMWKHIYALGHAAASNVQFVYCPSCPGSTVAARYPGDAYVDILAVDGYVDSTALGEPYQSFTDRFSAAYAALAGLNATKPIAVIETASAGSTLSPAAYMNSMFSVLGPSGAFPRLTRVNWFNDSAQGFDIMGQSLYTYSIGIKGFRLSAFSPYFPAGGSAAAGVGSFAQAWHPTFDPTLFGGDSLALVRGKVSASVASQWRADSTASGSGLLSSVTISRVGEVIAGKLDSTYGVMPFGPMPVPAADMPFDPSTITAWTSEAETNVVTSGATMTHLVGMVDGGSIMTTGQRGRLTFDLVSTDGTVGDVCAVRLYQGAMLVTTQFATITAANVRDFYTTGVFDLAAGTYTIKLSSAQPSVYAFIGSGTANRKVYEQTLLVVGGGVNILANAASAATATVQALDLLPTWGGWALMQIAKGANCGMLVDCTSEDPTEGAKVYDYKYDGTADGVGAAMFAEGLTPQPRLCPGDNAVCLGAGVTTNGTPTGLRYSTRWAERYVRPFGDS